LLGVKESTELPVEPTEEAVLLFLASTEQLIGQYGEEWVKKSAPRLLEELEYLKEM
jgi:hypothetical protein